MNLFQKGGFTLNSGQTSELKIECDALTTDDWKTLAHIVSGRMSFRTAIGVPRGGLPFATELIPYCVDDPKLPTILVDDVLTTGHSMEKLRKEISGPVIGVVVFARGPYPRWITPIFQMW